MKKQVLMTLASALVLASGVARADLVVNGGFETGDFTGWNTAALNATGVVSSGFDGYPANSGDFFVAGGNVGGLGFISQTLATVSGGNYTLSVFVAGNGSPNEFGVEWNGAVLFDQQIPAQPYTQYTFNVVGTGSDTLTLSNLDNPSYIAIDDVSVVGAAAVPEPASLTLLGAALLGFGMLRRRNRRA